MHDRGWRFVIIGLVVLGCSTQEEVSFFSEAKPRQKASTASPRWEVPSENSDARSSLKLSRSELRVLAEHNKASEAQAQAIIESFSQHLEDPLERQSLENEFKRLLPVYKANQLELGKAKLREVSNHGH